MLQCTTRWLSQTFRMDRRCRLELICGASEARISRVTQRRFSRCRPTSNIYTLSMKKISRCTCQCYHTHLQYVKYYGAYACSVTSIFSIILCLFGVLCFTASLYHYYAYIKPEAAELEAAEETKHEQQTDAQYLTDSTELASFDKAHLKLREVNAYTNDSYTSDATPADADAVRVGNGHANGVNMTSPAGNCVTPVVGRNGVTSPVGNGITSPVGNSVASPIANGGAVHDVDVPVLKFRESSQNGVLSEKDMSEFGLRENYTKTKQSMFMGQILNTRNIKVNNVTPTMIYCTYCVYMIKYLINILQVYQRSCCWRSRSAPMCRSS